MSIVLEGPGVARFLAGAALATGLAVAAGPALAKKSACSAAASAQAEACKSEVKDDFFTRKAVCLNLSDEAARDACFDEAALERKEGGEDCRDQREARRDLCEALGEDRYEPDFDPANFDADFTNLTSPNPYFPLGIGSTWEYAEGDDTVSIEVLSETKLILGVTCIVVNDREEQDGVVVEETDDWFGQKKDGSVVYCGEISQNFELFPGDVPLLPELEDVDGSWKAGRDGALPGILFQGAPAVGQVYRQEWSPGDAEDAARVLSTSYAFGADAELDEFVPQALAELLCAAADCVVTGEFTPIEPDAFERKYYARGIGLFLEVSPEDGDVVQLVGCNVDPKCASLPTP